MTQFAPNHTELYTTCVVRALSSHPGNIWSWLDNRGCVKAGRLRSTLLNCHKEWLSSNGSGHTGRFSESRRTAVGCGDNHLTRTRSTSFLLVGGLQRCRGRLIPSSLKPEIFTNMITWTVIAVRVCPTVNVPLNLIKSRRPLEFIPTIWRCVPHALCIFIEP